MLIKLTRKTESQKTWDPIWINIRAIITVMSHPVSGETWVSTGPSYHIVKETPEEVMRLVEEVRVAWRASLIDFFNELS